MAAGEREGKSQCGVVAVTLRRRRGRGAFVRCSCSTVTESRLAPLTKRPLLLSSRHTLLVNETGVEILTARLPTSPPLWWEAEGQPLRS